ncbi:MAG TPA: D-alanyl-D-alanine carboxypeptidase/D-alanyl-D-alanine-endopeptidase [Gemmatimonadaceae bacterium]|nr:D-alanyl-D-alanine carboxypeptidase/D-alanyl-D-alanine-endopeptidase [Gemmatimonadaceae bacterium]
MKLSPVVTMALLSAGCASGGTGAANPSPRAVNARAALRFSIDSMVQQSEFRSAQFGVLIVDPEKGDTLYSLNAGKLFMPASNMKIVTGATSLAQLGPDFTFRTEFAAGGRVVRDTLQGALIVNGRGDPTISDHMRGSAMKPLYDVADSLKAHGITAIAGGIRSGINSFPDTTIGWGWSWDDLGEDYGAGVDELYFNEGFGTVVVDGRAGHLPDSATVFPIHSYPTIKLYGTTPNPEVTDTFQLRLDPSKDGRGFYVRGRLKTNSDTVIVVYPNQRDAYLAALREALMTRGIGFDSTALRTMIPGPGKPVDALNPTPLFTIHSPPLRAILPALEKPSQNQIAEILYKTLGLEKTGVGSGDSGQVVLSRQLATWGAQPDGYLIRDGSGLSRYGYLSPETLVRVLDKIRADTAFHVFYDALPIAGVDGSLRNRMKGTAAVGKIHAKTGSVANVRSLSGYATTADDHLVLFSLLANNWTTTQSAVDSVHNRIAVLLASLKLRDAQ